MRSGWNEKKFKLKLWLSVIQSCTLYSWLQAMQASRQTTFLLSLMDIKSVWDSDESHYIHRQRAFQKEPPLLSNHLLLTPHYPISSDSYMYTCSTVSSTLYIPLVLSRKDLATEGSVSSITLSWLLWLELGSSLLLISCNTHNEIK